MSMPDPGAAPQQVAPRSVARKQGSGCAGCLRGCLIILLVLLVLLAVGAIAFMTVGRAYIASELPRWRQENEYIELADEYLNIEERLGIQQPQYTNADRKPGTSDKQDLPGDIPVYPAALEEAYNIGGDHVMVFQRVAQTPNEVTSYFQTAMPRNGWKAASERTVENGLVLGWSKEQRACQTEIVDRTAPETEIYIRCTARGGE